MKRDPGRLEREPQPEKCSSLSAMYRGRLGGRPLVGARCLENLVWVCDVGIRCYYCFLRVRIIFQLSPVSL